MQKFPGTHSPAFAFPAHQKRVRAGPSRWATSRWSGQGGLRNLGRARSRAPGRRGWRPSARRSNRRIRWPGTGCPGLVARRDHSTPGETMDPPGQPSARVSTCAPPPSSDESGQPIRVKAKFECESTRLEAGRTCRIPSCAPEGAQAMTSPQVALPAPELTRQAALRFQNSDHRSASSPFSAASSGSARATPRCRARPARIPTRRCPHLSDSSGSSPSHRPISA